MRPNKFLQAHYPTTQPIIEVEVRVSSYSLHGVRQSNYPAPHWTAHLRPATPHPKQPLHHQPPSRSASPPISQFCLPLRSCMSCIPGRLHLSTVPHRCATLGNLPVFRVPLLAVWPTPTQFVGRISTEAGFAPGRFAIHRET